MSSTKDREALADAATEARSRILNINVGILGHVDSGKTSLVKALSTSLSTAALDKHPQSQQRGITLDLGFSAFTLPLPERLRKAAEDAATTSTEPAAVYDLVQFTLVDCPGHASLIRTVIGGAHIIDMIILVIDANKGIQTQTAECIVIGEITTDSLLIALNKVDMLPENEREERITRVTRRIRKTLAGTKFADAPIVPVAAAVGGEKVAATNLDNADSAGTSGSGGSGNGNSKTSFKSGTESVGVDSLIELIKQTVPFPKRNIHAPFYFAIDHCFPIKGHGTVLTGTVLSGSIAVNQSLEIPRLGSSQFTRKVKSMQMFHQPVKYAKQGDRVGICVTNLDAKLIERDVACTPGSLPLISRAIAMVKKVRFFNKFPVKSGAKFHISVGHSTVVATVTFFGSHELALAAANTTTTGTTRAVVQQGLINSSFQRSFPTHIEYDPNRDYLLQDEILDPTTSDGGVQYALLELQQPVYCPLGSLVIGSRLDVDTTVISGTGHDSTPGSGTGGGGGTCRLAFFGPIRHLLPQSDSITTSGTGDQSHILHHHSRDVNIFIWKQKDCEVSKIVEVDDETGLVKEAIGWKLVTEGNSIQPFIGLKVVTESGVVGTIVSSFGADGKFRVKFGVNTSTSTGNSSTAGGARLQEGSKLLFRFKRYVFDKDRAKKLEQDTEALLTAEMTVRDEPVEGWKEMKEKEREKKEKEREKERERLKEKEKGKEKKSQSVAVPTQSPAAVAPTVAPAATTVKPVASPSATAPPAAIATSIPANAVVTTTVVDTKDKERRDGKIDSIKDETSGEYAGSRIAIVSSLFRMEENVRDFVGYDVFDSVTMNVIGRVVAPFGKLGKCKVQVTGSGVVVNAGCDVVVYIGKR